MADKDEKKGKKYDVEGEAKATGEAGDEHQVDVKGEATVTPLNVIEGANEPKTVTVDLPGGAKLTYTIGSADDPTAQQSATADAARDTAKAAAGASGTSRPSAFTRSGGVD